VVKRLKAVLKSVTTARVEARVDARGAARYGLQAREKVCLASSNFSLVQGGSAARLRGEGAALKRAVHRP
jgi:hypothetical protein